MNIFKYSRVQVSAALVSLAVNVVLFAALSTGFGGVTTTQLAVLQLPSVTVVGKRLLAAPVQVEVARKRADEIKL